MKRFSRFLLWATVCAVIVAVAASPAFSADNIKMGFVFSMTGGSRPPTAPARRKGRSWRSTRSTPPQAAGLQIVADFRG